MDDKAKYVIWCEQQKGWRKKPGGFTNSLDKAARFDLVKARRIADGCDHDEWVMFAPESVEKLLRLWQSFWDAVSQKAADRSGPPAEGLRPIEAGDIVRWRGSRGLVVWRVMEIRSGGDRPWAELESLADSHVHSAGYVDVLERVS